MYNLGVQIDSCIENLVSSFIDNVIGIHGLASIKIKLQNPR